jgi:hypothetical protein
MNWPVIILITIVSTFGCIALDQVVNGRGPAVGSGTPRTGAAEPGAPVEPGSAESRKRR